MPCLILTGHPCVGKTTFAKLLGQRALQHKSRTIHSVIIINEESACPNKTKYQCYMNSQAEKETRSALKTEFDKHCSSAGRSTQTKKEKTDEQQHQQQQQQHHVQQDRLIILDSMNYIKGYRYELHCISRAAEERHAVVWVMCSDPHVAKLWNHQRRQQQRQGQGRRETKEGVQQQQQEQEKDPFYYTDELMDELMLRYEPPDERNRWDRPLYRVDVLSSALQTTSVESTTSDWQQKNTTATNATSMGHDVKEKPHDGTRRAAEEALQRSVYNMHNLSDAIKAPTTTTTTTTTMATAMPKVVTTSAASSFKKAPLTKFRRKQTPVPSSGNGTTTTADTNTDTMSEPTSSKNEGGGADAEAGHDKLRTMDDIIDEILDSFLLGAKPLKEGKSTLKHVSAEANVLHEVDSITQRISNAILSAQKLSSSSSLGPGAGGGKISIPVGGGSSSSSSAETESKRTIITMELTRTVHLAEIRKLQRQYMKWITTHPPRDLRNEVGIAKSFVSYIETQL